MSPINVYGASKLRGEELVLNNDPSSIIIRTSWVYSSYGNNFVKTMLRLMKERDEVNVVDNQFGSPTYAYDLASAIMDVIDKDDEHTGIYNYCNEGITTWYEFARAIKKITKSECKIHPVPASQYPTPAKRPGYSVLDTRKIKETFGLKIAKWKDALQRCLALIEEN